MYAISGPKSNTPYTDLKNVFSLCDSKQMQINRLLQSLELSDMKSSQLLRRIKGNGKENVDDEEIKMIWFKRLPIRPQEILPPTMNSLKSHDMPVSTIQLDN